MREGRVAHACRTGATCQGSDEEHTDEAHTRDWPLVQIFVEIRLARENRGESFVVFVTVFYMLLIFASVFVGVFVVFCSCFL